MDIKKRAIVKKRQLLILLSYSTLLFFCFWGDDVIERIYILLLFILCTHRLNLAFCKTGEFLIFDPLNYFLLNFFLIHGLGYFCYLSRNSLGICEFNFDSITIQNALLVSILAVIVLLIAFKIGSRGKHVYNHIYSELYNNRKFSVKEKKWYLLIILIIVMFMLLWTLMGGIPFLTPGFHESGRAEMGKGLGLLEAICNTVLVSSQFYFIWKILKGEQFNKFSFIYFLSVVIILTLSDSRSLVVGYSVQVAMIYYLCAKHIPLKTYILGALLLVFFAVAMGVQRARNSEGNLAQMGMILGTEMYVEFDNYVETFDMYDKVGGLNGSTLIPIFTVPVPRAIMPDKDKFLTAGNYFKEYHGHWHIRVGERMTYIGELILNWGIWGVVLGMSVMGLFMSFIVCGRKHLNDILSIFLLICLSYAPIGFIAGDIVTNFVGFFMTNLWFIIYYFLRKMSKSHYHKTVKYE